MNIALVPMSAKPYHLGHHKLIQLAEASHDVVLVFVSYSSRGVRKIKDPHDRRTIKAGARKIEVPKKGEIPIFGKDMQYIWESFLLDGLDFSDKVRFITPTMGAHVSPIRNIHTVCESLLIPGMNLIPFLDKRMSTSELTVSIYSDSNDVIANYSMKEMTRMYGELIGSQILLVGIDRGSTVDISGTKMRKLLSVGHLQEFQNFLPPVTKKAKNIIAKILSDSIASGCSFYCREQQKKTSKVYRGILITPG